MQDQFTAITGKAIIVIAFKDQQVIYLKMFEYPDEQQLAHDAFSHYNYSDMEVYMMTKERFLDFLDMKALRGEETTNQKSN